MPVILDSSGRDVRLREGDAAESLDGVDVKLEGGGLVSWRGEERRGLKFEKKKGGLRM